MNKQRMGVSPETVAFEAYWRYSNAHRTNHDPEHVARLAFKAGIKHDGGYWKVMFHRLWAEMRRSH